MANLFKRFNDFKSLFFEFGSYSGDFEDDALEINTEREETPVETPTQVKADRIDVTPVAPTQKQLIPWTDRRTTDLIGCSWYTYSFPIPMRKPDLKGKSTFAVKVQDYTYKIITDNGDIPHGQDQHILLFVDDLARVEKSKTIVINSIYGFLKHIGLGTGKRQLEQFKQTMTRLTNSRFSAQYDPDQSIEALSLLRSVKYFKNDRGGGEGVEIELTTTHFERLMTEPVPPFDRGVLSILASDMIASKMYRLIGVKCAVLAEDRLDDLKAPALKRIPISSFTAEVGCRHYSRKREEQVMLKEKIDKVNEALKQTGSYRCPVFIDRKRHTITLFEGYIIPGIKNGNRRKERAAQSQSQDQAPSPVVESATDANREKLIQQIYDNLTDEQMDEFLVAGNMLHSFKAKKGTQMARCYIIEAIANSL